VTNFRPGLLEREVDAPEVRGVASPERFDNVVVPLDSRGRVGISRVEGASSKDLIIGELPRSPEDGSNTLSGDISVGFSTFELPFIVRGDSERSKIRRRLPCSERSFVRSLSLSGVSGSNEKSSFKTSTISRYGTFSALFKTVASAGFKRTMRW
jgi:hypothetical protein